MKVFYIFTLLFFFNSLSYSQTADNIYREANPDVQNFIDNSPYAQLWQQVVEAKKSGNEILHSHLLQRLNSEHPEYIHNRPAGFDGPQAVDLVPEPPFNNQSDWGPGDVRVFLGDVYAGGTNTESGGNIRTVRLRVDSLGNKYIAFIRSTRDTLYIFRSTDEGMNWTRIQRIFPGGTNLWHSFDFFVTDTTGGFKLGFAASVVPTAGSHEGTLYFFSMNENGLNFFVTQIEPTPSGRGLINPSIVSDGYLYSPGITYWYVTYQNFSTSTPTANPVKTAYSADWGSNWTTTNVRTAFNDYDVCINYNKFPAEDTIYVMVTNNVTLASPNLRIFRRPLSSFTGSWTQFNLTQTADAERYGQLVVNRQNNQMVAGYSKASTVVYQYTTAGSYFNTTSPVLVSANATYISLDCQESQGAYRMSFHSQSGTYDTIVYKSTFDPVGGFAGHQIVNSTNDASPSVASSVAGYRTGGGFGGGVTFAGFGPTHVWYDGSNIIPTTISENNSEIPESYKLAQNYPNPFNPITTINFSIPKSGLVKLVVYDIMGREIKTLLNSEINAGNYEYLFDASNLGSGVYFYKLESGSFSEIKRMVLVK